MNHIAKALERVRLGEQGKPSSSPAASASFLPSAPAGGTPPALAQIVYTKTRTVQVSNEFLREKHVINGKEPGQYTSAFKILRTQILQRLREKNWNALAVTSPRGNEGKTLCAVNLAISLSLEVDRTVLLIDADLQNPRVHACLGLPLGAGLGDYLANQMPIEDLLVHPGLGKLVILPGGTPLTNSSELLGSDRMQNLVKEVKNRYAERIVLFDLPPVLSAADTMAFAPYVDAALLVVEENKTRREDVMQATTLLSATDLIGVVLNKSREVHKLRGKRATWINRFIERWTA